MPPSPPSNPEDHARLAASFLRLNRWLRRMSASVNESTGLRREQFSVLVILEECGEMRPTGLGEVLGVEASVATRRVAHLEALGLVARRPDPADGRASLVSLTAAGNAALMRTRRDYVRQVAAATAGWSPDELTRLVADIERFLADVEGAPAPPPSAVPAPTTLREDDASWHERR